MHASAPRSISIVQALCIAGVALFAAHRVLEEQTPPTTGATSAPSTIESAPFDFEALGRPILVRRDHARRVLSNGLEVIVDEQPGEPIIASTLSVLVGSGHEPSNRGGLAHLVEHLQFRDRDFGRGIWQIGGSSNAFTHHHVTNYHQIAPAAQLEGVAWLAMQRLVEPEFTEYLVTQERKVVEAERGWSADIAYTATIRHALEDLWAGHPYGEPILGPVSEVAAITPHDVRAFWSRAYTPVNTRWIVSGGVEAEAVFEVAERMLGWIPSGEPLPPIPPPRPTHLVPLTDAPEVHPIPTPDAVHSLVLATSFETDTNLERTSSPSPWEEPGRLRALYLGLCSLGDEREGVIAQLREEFGAKVELTWELVPVPGAIGVVVQVSADPWPGGSRLADSVADALREIGQVGLSEELHRRTHHRVSIVGASTDHPDERVTGLAWQFGNRVLLEESARGEERSESFSWVANSEVRTAFEDAFRTVRWLHADPDLASEEITDLEDDSTPREPSAAYAEITIPDPPIPGEEIAESIPVTLPPPPTPWIAVERTTLPSGVRLVVHPDRTARFISASVHIHDGVSVGEMTESERERATRRVVIAEASVPERAQILSESFGEGTEFGFHLYAEPLDRTTLFHTIGGWLAAPELDRVRMREIEERWVGEFARACQTPESLAAVLAIHELGPAPPPPMVGMASDLEEDELIAEWRTAVVPEHTTILLGGPFTAEEILPELERALARWLDAVDRSPARGNPVPAVAGRDDRDSGSHRSGQRRRRAIIAPMEAEHVQLYAVHPASTPRHPETAPRRQIALDRLAEQTGWWLFEMFREHHGFSYAPAAEASDRAEDEALWIGLDLPPGVLIQVIDDLEEGLSHYRNANTIHPGHEPIVIESTLAMSSTGMKARLGRLFDRIRFPHQPTFEESLRAPLETSFIAQRAAEVYAPENRILVVAGPVSEEERAALAERFDTLEVVDPETVFRRWSGSGPAETQEE